MKCGGGLKAKVGLFVSIELPISLHTKKPPGSRVAPPEFYIGVPGTRSSSSCLSAAGHAACADMMPTVGADRPPLRAPFKQDSVSPVISPLALRTYTGARNIGLQQYPRLQEPLCRALSFPDQRLKLLPFIRTQPHDISLYRNLLRGHHRPRRSTLDERITKSFRIG
jgi:hypothetical protein